MDKETQITTTNKPVYLSWLQSPQTALNNITALTVKDAIYSKSPSIFRLSLVGNNVAVSVLNLLIADFVQFLNVGKSMNAQQVLQTSKLILEDKDMKNLKPDDFKIAFNNAKKGYYGKSFDRVDGQTIFEILHAYMAEKLELHENLAQQLHEERKKGIVKPEEVNKEGQKRVLEILKQVIEKPEIKERSKPVKSERDVFIQKCFADFYALKSDKRNLWKAPKKEKSEYNGLIDSEGSTDRFINYEGKPLDELEYVALKVKEYDLNKS